MQDISSAVLTRDCEATQIPIGTTITLPAGTAVDITQTLGGSYTVQAQGGLFRIASKDADALGLQPAESKPTAAEASGPVNEEALWQALRSCYDPEIPVNIVDLGLVYELQLEALPSGGNRVAVKMTLTAPGCGMGATIAGDAQQKLLAVPGVADADVQIVWEPAWHHSRISPAGRALLGLD
ncbi:MAG: putative Fe-S cluster assembly protein SufT [Verrucomicrobiota bacterium]